MPVFTKELKIQFLKFLGIGVLNTLVTLFVIYILMSLNVNYKLSNLIGYIAGVVNSFVWNKTWVFGSKNNIFREIAGFLFSFCICYGIQYLMLMWMVEYRLWNTYLAQLIAMGVYTVLNFLMNRFITFRKNQNK
ncbi:MAG: GtrA family protein [Bacteroidales bacterium]